MHELQSAKVVALRFGEIRFERPAAIALLYLLKVAVVNIFLHLPHLCGLRQLCLLRRSHFNNG